MASDARLAARAAVVAGQRIVDAASVRGRGNAAGNALAALVLLRAVEREVLGVRDSAVEAALVARAVEAARAARQVAA